MKKSTNAAMYFSYEYNGQWYVFVKGNLYTSLVQLYVYNDSQIVTPSTESRIMSATSILRKVMLQKLSHNYPADSYVVIDYCRPRIPISQHDVVVPIHPLVGDMLKVNGDNDDVWIAHVLAVNTESKTCRAHFYVESVSVQGQYVRESTGQASNDVIHWDSILGIADGYWQSGLWISLMLNI